MTSQSLINKGTLLLNREKLQDGFSPIIVLGPARGGTSIVAGALHHLGLFTGTDSIPPVFEDAKLGDAFETADEALIQEIISGYNKDHPLWAWKRPSALNHLDLIEQIFPNALYIMCFKDIFSIADRNATSMLLDIKKGLKNALSDYETMVSFISKTDRPMLLVSAEKSLRYREHFVDQLINLLSAHADYNGNKVKAVEFISPYPEQYLDSSRITNYIGRVGGVIDDAICGWAAFAHTDHPAIVELYINNDLYKTVIASEPRPHLVENGIHTKETCGFSFPIDDTIRTTDKTIMIKGKGDAEPLENGIIDLNKMGIK